MKYKHAKATHRQSAKAGQLPLGGMGGGGCLAGKGCTRVLCGDGSVLCLVSGGGSHRCLPLSQPTEWSLLYVNYISINHKKRRNKNEKEGRKTGGREGRRIWDRSARPVGSFF